MVCIEWLQLMSQVRDRVRGRAPLLLVLCGALLLVMGGWPVRCTAMPKELLSNRSGSTTVKCESSILPVKVHLDTAVTATVMDGDRDLGSSESGGGGFDGAAEGPQRTSASLSSGAPGTAGSELWVVGEGVAGNGGGPVSPSVRILSRPDRSVSSINSGASSPLIRLRHRMHGGSASGGGNNSISSRPRANSASNRTKSGSNLERNERSANLSHVNSKIQLFIKNRLLQILPDGTVNGTQDDASDFSEYLLVISIVIINTIRH